MSRGSRNSLASGAIASQPTKAQKSWTAASPTAAGPCEEKGVKAWGPTLQGLALGYGGTAASQMRSAVARLRRVAGL
jgi:cytochrome c551/c552